MNDSISARVLYFCVFLLFVMISPSCDTKGKNRHDQEVHRDSFSPLKIRYASGLKISKNEIGDFKVQIRDSSDSTKILHNYLLTARASDRSPSSIQVPIYRAALNSTTFVAFFDALCETDRIVGVSYAGEVMNTSLRKRFTRGDVKEITSAGTVDYEKVAEVEPDLCMVYEFGNVDYSRVQDLQIPVMVNMEYAESHPLGRAEWIKFVGCLLGKYDMADSLFAALEGRYTLLQAKAASKSLLPQIFSASKFQGSWSAPAGESYFAQLISDAGGNYTFSRRKGSGSVQLDEEIALANLYKADFWGLVVHDENGFSWSDLQAYEENYLELAAVQNRNVFICNSAAVDYFGAGVMEPDALLGDLISIFHPDLLPIHQKKYFKPLDQ